MKISLRERTRESVAVYFEKAGTDEIRSVLPQRARTLEEALEDYQKTLLPGATSYGRIIYAGEKYVGALTYASNISSVRVLEKNGFCLMEIFVEDGIVSKYFQIQ